MMAGYKQEKLDDSDDAGPSDDVRTSMIIPIDVRVIYTDVVHIVANDAGLVMNFLQGGANSMQPLVISRVGMSRDYAEHVLEMLQKALAESKPKSLPAPKDHKQKRTEA